MSPTANKNIKKNRTLDFCFINFSSCLQKKAININGNIDKLQTISRISGGSVGILSYFHNSFIIIDNVIINPAFIILMILLALSAGKNGLLKNLQPMKKH